jgi:hypothetical protein
MRRRNWWLRRMLYLRWCVWWLRQLLFCWSNFVDKLL